ncbi:hypothetical protein Mapa_008655 [Marchantia paleacea]|nr:hypothetical protein Mapa_008655 [Marchantia paleacea]
MITSSVQQDSQGPHPRGFRPNSDHNSCPAILPAEEAKYKTGASHPVTQTDWEGDGGLKSIGDIQHSYLASSSGFGQ